MNAFFFASIKIIFIKSLKFSFPKMILSIFSVLNEFYYVFIHETIPRRERIYEDKVFIISKDAPNKEKIKTSSNLFQTRNKTKGNWI
ncbi:hypothetical protein D0S45_13485 [Marinifilum sp. JC120]|nr:hypothetical protein D0S45_13485 [Marinifilum sp. JC120]